MRLVEHNSAVRSHMPNGKIMLTLALTVVAGIAVGRSRPVDAAPSGGEALMLLRIDALTKTVDALNRHVAELERAPASGVADRAQTGQRVTAPFEVVDKSGKVILSVSDGTYGDATTRGRVHIGRGTGDNYGVWVRRADQTLATSMGETKDGDGLVTVRDKAGNLRAEVWAANGINVYDQSGKKPIASIAPNESGKAARLKLMGSVKLRDDKDQPTFEAGENQQGGGLAHVFGKDGKIRAELDDDGIFLVSPAGKKVVSLGLNQAGASRAILDISGQLQIVDASGATTVEMGTVGTGVGVVRVGPRYRCGPGVPMVAGIPSCMVGVR